MKYCLAALGCLIPATPLLTMLLLVWGADDAAHSRYEIVAFNLAVVLTKPMLPLVVLNPFGAGIIVSAFWMPAMGWLGWKLGRHLQIKRSQ